MLIAPKPGVVQKAIALKKAQAQEQIAAQLARKDGASAHAPHDGDDDLDEDAINADVDNDLGDQP
jgi:hypothetical protein